MIHSQRSREGWLSINHRDSPGLTDAALSTSGAALPPGAGQGMFEAPTVTCSHCQTVVVLNPTRTRDRAYCARCDHYLCDGCGVTLTASGVCRPFSQIIAETIGHAARTASLIVTP